MSMTWHWLHSCPWTDCKWLKQYASNGKVITNFTSVVCEKLSKYEFKLSKYEFKLSKCEFELSKYEFELSKYEFKLSKYEFELSKYEFKLSKYEFKGLLLLSLIYLEREQFNQGWIWCHSGVSRGSFLHIRLHCINFTVRLHQFTVLLNLCILIINNV